MSDEEVDLAVSLFAELALGVACLVGETATEPFLGQVAVAEVIRNRMERHYNSDGTVAGTIMAPYQFSCLGDSTPWRARLFKLTWGRPEVREAKKAWQSAFDTLERTDHAKGAVLYHTIATPRGASVWPPRWAKSAGVVETTRIGGHVFYNDDGRIRR